MKPDQTSNDAVILNGSTGNLYSVYNALSYLGFRIKITQNAQEILSSRRVIMPGVGAFASFMQGLQKAGLVEAIHGILEKQIPILGICVGMQVLFEYGEENGVHPGLGFLSGCVKRFPALESLTIPQTGWNTLQFVDESDPLFCNITPNAHVYFNHGYYCHPTTPHPIRTYTDYGIRYASTVRSGNVAGVQFHPEKSHKVGLKLLSNFMTL